MAHLTSRQNPRLRHIRRLGADGAYRREQGLYLCDGGKLLADALRSGAEPQTVVSTEDIVLPELPGRTERITVPAPLMKQLSPLETPQGVLFTCKIPNPPAAPPSGGRWLLLDRLQDPGNVGSILRTAEAFALDGVFLTHGSADPFSPKAVRASMGAVFRLPVGIVSRETKFSKTLPIYAADIDNQTQHIDKVVFSDCIVVLGNEGSGIDPALRCRADQIISIPMRGGAESLGVAAAAAIIAWYVSR